MKVASASIVAVFLFSCGANAQPCSSSGKTGFRYASIWVTVQSSRVELIGLGTWSDTIVHFDLNSEVELVAVREQRADAGSPDSQRAPILLIVPRQRGGVIASEGGIGVACEFPGNGRGLAGGNFTKAIDLQDGWVLSVRKKTSGEVLLKW